jgi:quinol monooxygenase YgiN
MCASQKSASMRRKRTSIGRRSRRKIEASVRLEPGVLALQAVSDRDNPTRIIVFEIYTDEPAYRTHLETPHFRKYKAAVEGVVTSLKLTETVPIALNAKPG